EIEEHLAPLRTLQVDDERALPAIPADEREHRHPERVAVARLDLHDLRAEVAEQHRAERSRDEAREVEDADALEAGARRRARGRLGAAAPLATDGRRVAPRPGCRAGRGRGGVREERRRARLPGSSEAWIVDRDDEPERARV